MENLGNKTFEIISTQYQYLVPSENLLRLYADHPSF